MAEFRLKPIKAQNSKRGILLTSVVLLVTTVIPLYNVFARGEIMHGLTMILAFVSIIIYLLQLSKKAEANRKKWPAYLLVIDNARVTCTYTDGEVVSIEKESIVSVFKESIKGGIRINGHNGIFITPGIANFEVAEKMVIELTPTSLLDKNGRIRIEPNESIFQILSEVSANFTNFSILSVVIILLCYLKLASYYILYGINISSYLDPTEAILSFSHQWKEIVVILVCMAILHGMFGWIRLKAPNPKDTFTNRYILITGIGLYGSMLFFLLSLYDTLINSCAPERHVTEIFDKQFTVLPEIFFTVFLLTVTLVSGSVLFWHRDKIITIRYTIGAALLMTLLIMHAENTISHDCVEGGYGKYEVTLSMTNEEIVKTDQQLMFIGSTHNYYFFRDLKRKENVIIAKNAVIKERIKEIRIGL